MVIRIGNQWRDLREVVLQAFTAIDVELYAVTNDGPGDLTPYNAQHSLHRTGVEFADRATGDADGVVVMLRLREAVAGALH